MLNTGWSGVELLRNKKWRARSEMESKKRGKREGKGERKDERKDEVGIGENLSHIVEQDDNKVTIEG